MRIQPTFYLTSDTHFGHQKMVEWGHREETHNEDIVKAWNEVISKNDTVIHLGDLSFCNKESTRKWTQQLRGTKYIVRGNHDNQSNTWLRDVGFEPLPFLFKTFKTKYQDNLHVLFTHEPVRELPTPGNWFNIHGHLHGDNHRNINLAPWQPFYYDVGVDANEYKPVKLSAILDTFKKVLYDE